MLTPDEARLRAEKLVDKWEEVEDFSLRSGFREALERLIEELILEIQKEAIKFQENEKFNEGDSNKNSERPKSKDRIID